MEPADAEAAGSVTHTLHQGNVTRRHYLVAARRLSYAITRLVFSKDKNTAVAQGSAIDARRYLPWLWISRARHGLVFMQPQLRHQAHV